jgi:hypothetical protein
MQNRTCGGGRAGNQPGALPPGRRKGEETTKSQTTFSMDEPTPPDCVYGGLYTGKGLLTVSGGACLCVYVCSARCLPSPVSPLLLLLCLCSSIYFSCGNSDGEVISLGHYEAEDTGHVLRRLRTMGAGAMVLWGRSMGAVTALLYACSSFDPPPSRQVVIAVGAGAGIGNQDG